MQKRYTKPTFFILILAFLAVACGPNPKDAKAYKEKLGAIHYRVVQIGDSLEDAFASYDTMQIKYTMYRANIVSKNAIEDLKHIKPITPDSVLYKRTGQYFQTFRQVLGNEYREKLHLYCIPDEAFTYQNQQEVARLDASKKEKLRTAARNLKEAEQEFAERYNLKIID